MADVMGDLLSLLLPPVCVGCGVLLRAPTSTRCLCRACDLTVRPLPPSDRRLGDVEALFAFEGALAQALARLKYAGDRPVAGPLGRLLTHAPILDDAPWDALVPVPPHLTRRLRRGFCHVELLAAHLLALRGRTGPPLRRWLRRRRATPPQRGLSAAARRRNVAGAFVVPRCAPVHGRRVLVLDDVTTTGATLAAAMGALRRAGAERVAALALMRVAT